MYTYVGTHIYTCRDVYIYMYISVYVYISVYIHMNTYVCTYSPPVNLRPSSGLLGPAAGTFLPLLPHCVRQSPVFQNTVLWAPLTGLGVDIR